MKNTIKLFAFAAIVSGFFFTSCKKSTTTTNTNTTPSTSTFTFKKDGTLVNVDSAKATIYTSVLTGTRMIDVYAFAGGSQVLEMHFAPTTGSRAVDKTFANSWLTYISATDYYDGTSGTLNITKCDTVNNKIEGTFNFSGAASIGTGSANITDGNMVVSSMTHQ